MKHIIIFEKFKNDVKNKIFIIDISGSFLEVLKKNINKINFYLASNFTAFLCDTEIQIHPTINLKILPNFIMNIDGGGGGGLQMSIDYIIRNNLKGPVLLYSDGNDNINITELENDFTYLTTDLKPRIKSGDKKNFNIFYNDLESLENFYKPRDITIEDYEFKKTQHKYNL